MEAKLRPIVDFRDLAEVVNFAIVITELHISDAVVVYANKAFEELTGYAELDIVGRDCRFLQGEETDPDTIATIRRGLLSGEPLKVEILNYRKNGERFWNELHIAPRFSDDGRIVGHVGIQADVSRRRLAEEAARVAEARLNGIIENIPGYIYQRVLKPNGEIKFTYISPSFARFLKLKDKQIGKDFRKKDYMDISDIEILEKNLKYSADNMTPINTDFRIVSPDGEERWIRSYSKPRRSGDDVVWDVIGIDITTEKTAEARLNFLASNDPLTGLPNRSLFAQSLYNALMGLTDGEVLLLAHIDVCAMQEINESLGRASGDAALRRIANALSGLATAQGRQEIARTGGDEFAVYGVLSADDDPEAFVHTIRHRLADQLPIEDHPALTSVCMGIVVHPVAAKTAIAPADPATELSRQADIALSLAKRDGPGSWRLYDIEDDYRIRHRALLKQSLHRAIGEGHFEMHYHPLVNLASGRIVGAEALIRWAHPDLGMQSPESFIPIAEETGLIVPLGEWIIREVMRQAQQWRNAGIDVPRLSINVSARQFQRKDLLDVLERALLEFGGSGHDFDLEITEGTLVSNSAEILTLLRRIAALGFTLSADDFGTGYSSLIYLRDLPVTKLKIDQTFVRHIVVDSSDASIVRAILAMARSLRLDVVAEGIETMMQRDFLHSEGCLIGQGYLFSVPLVAKDFGHLLQQSATLPLQRSAQLSASNESPPLTLRIP